jgi:hypothetical protein
MDYRVQVTFVVDDAAKLENIKTLLNTTLQNWTNSGTIRPGGGYTWTGVLVPAEDSGSKEFSAL